MWNGGFASPKALTVLNKMEGWTSITDNKDVMGLSMTMTWIATLSSEVRLQHLDIVLSIQCIWKGWDLKMLSKAKISHHMSQTSRIKEPSSQDSHECIILGFFFFFGDLFFSFAILWVSGALVKQCQFTALYRLYLNLQATWVAFHNSAQNRVVCVRIKAAIALSSSG